jgi:uncharacterized protein with HEPN domain
MLEYAGIVSGYVDGKNEADFLEDRQLRDAVAYNLQVIGEAAYQVSDELKEATPEVDWFKIAGLRHRIVHDYRRVDDVTLWRITQKYVPPLIGLLERILERGVD